MKIAEVLGVEYEQRFILKNGSEVSSCNVKIRAVL